MVCRVMLDGAHELVTQARHPIADEGARGGDDDELRIRYLDARCMAGLEAYEQRGLDAAPTTSAGSEHP